MAFMRRISDRLYRMRRNIATAGIVALAFLLAIHVVFGANGMVAYEKKKTEYKALQKDVDRIQKENEALSQRIQNLKSDPAAIEKEAREQLRYARPGEVIYTYPNPPQRPAPPVAAKK